MLDIVPNHMATDDTNRYWSDPELRAQFFDIDEKTGRHRRFFDIDHLAAVRQEDPEVFAETHKLALRLVRDGVVDGLRIDHPDGLADPAGYLERLREGGAEHVWVEKILDPGEPLRDWPVDGTVGYEFLNDVCGLFVDPAGEAPLTDLWVEVSGDDRRFGELAFEAKLEQARTAFAPEVERLAREAPAAGRRARAGAGVAAGLPHLRGAVVGQGRRRGPRTPSREARAARIAGVEAAARAAGLGGVRHALPADDAAGDGQGRRGHGVLPLRAAARAERRRRGPGAVLGQREATSTAATPSGRRASRATCSSRRRTTRSARATCARGSARSRRCRTSSPRTCAPGSQCAGR